MIDYGKELNTSQYRAVTSIDGPYLVIAGAGSGKTRVIQYRVNYLLEQGVKPENILLLTFTRKASQEMLDRAAFYDQRARKVEGGTFHSFGYKLLKKYGKSIGLSQSFTIIDESDAQSMIQKCIQSLGIDTKSRIFPKKKTLKAIFSASINKRKKIEKILEGEYPQYWEYSQDIEKIQKAYQASKIQSGYVDYDDILVYTKMILDNEVLREKISKKYSHIMLDEYQDTNKIQAEIALHLCNIHGNIMVVGDDAQSIYGFRGAYHANIIRFPEQFASCELIKLEENYRSTQPILDLSNAVLKDMRSHYDKDLISAGNVHGTQPEFYQFKNTYDEASWIADKILELRDEGFELEDQAILFRSAYTSIALQAELSSRGIPFQVFGGMKFYETAHAKDIIAFYKIIHNPNDELAWSRILCLFEGVGPSTADKIFESMSGASKEDQPHILSSFAGSKKYGTSLVKFSKVLVRMHAGSATPELIYKEILDFYEPLLKKSYDDWPARLQDLQSLEQIISNYNNIADLLADFTLEPPERAVQSLESDSFSEKPLTLSTIHSAKGLEWKAVYFIGMIEGVLPHTYSLDEEDDIEEERRLFYVGITRAKTSLFLTFHHEGSRGGMQQFNRPSRFLESSRVQSAITIPMLETQAEDEVIYIDGDSVESDPEMLYNNYIDYLEEDMD